MRKNIKFFCLSLMWSPFFVHATQVTIKNNLPNSGNPCVKWGGNKVQVFLPDNSQKIIDPTGQITVSGQFDAWPNSLGLQVNNWYWLQGDETQKYPVGGQGTDHQNPDNSGANFYIDDSCTLQCNTGIYGKGVQTYYVANITISGSNGNCTITIEPNDYTNAVTPGCCSYSTCTDALRGQTDSKQGWPPTSHACPAKKNIKKNKNNIIRK